MAGPGSLAHSHPETELTIDVRRFPTYASIHVDTDADTFVDPGGQSTCPVRRSSAGTCSNVSYGGGESQSTSTVAITSPTTSGFRNDTVTLTSPPLERLGSRDCGRRVGGGRRTTLAITPVESAPARRPVRAGTRPPPTGRPGST